MNNIEMLAAMFDAEEQLKARWRKEVEQMSPDDKAIKLGHPLTCSGCGDPSGWVALATRWESGVWTLFVLCVQCSSGA